MLPHLYLDSITTLAIPVNLGHANKVFKNPLQAKSLYLAF